MSADTDRLLRTRTVCQLLDCPERTFRRWLSAGKVPPADLRIGKSQRWRLSTIAKWLTELEKRK